MKNCLLTMSIFTSFLTGCNSERNCDSSYSKKMDSLIHYSPNVADYYRESFSEAIAILSEEICDKISDYDSVIIINRAGRGIQSHFCLIYAEDNSKYYYYEMDNGIITKHDEADNQIFTALKKLRELSRTGPEEYFLNLKATLPKVPDKASTFIFLLDKPRMKNNLLSL